MVSPSSLSATWYGLAGPLGHREAQWELIAAALRDRDHADANARLEAGSPWPEPACKGWFDFRNDVVLLPGGQLRWLSHSLGQGSDRLASLPPWVMAAGPTPALQRSATTRHPDGSTLTNDKEAVSCPMTR